ncbi:MAG: hypothetical protein KBT35_08290 [Firmicutes bacterium]|nr:hypothetical protein [Candidatus Colivicinus equi]
MKLIKNVMISMLTVFMLFTSVGYGRAVVAEENEETTIIEENEKETISEGNEQLAIPERNEELVTLEKNDEDLEREIEEALYGIQSGEPFPIPTDYLKKVTDISNTFIGAFGKKGAEYFTKMTSGIVGIYSLSMDILQSVGAFGMTDEEKNREALNNRLNAIDSKLDEIDKKVDSLQNTLNEAIKAIDEELKTISVKLDKENITAVANIATTLKNEMNNYDATLTSQIHTWYENENIGDYLTTTKLYVVSVPETKASDSGDVKIKVQKDLMVDEIDNYTIDHLDDGDDGWDPEKKEEIVESIFTAIFDSMIEDEAKTGEGYLHDWIKGYDSSFEDWTSYDKKDEIRKVFADAGLLSLSIRAAKNIATAKSSGATTYVAGLIDNFAKYTNYLSESEGRYTSPLRSQYNIYSALNAFQGDLKLKLTYKTKDESGKEIEKELDTNLADLAMKNYVGELGDLGTFVGIMAKASGNYGEETDMRKLVYIPWAAAEDKLIKTYEEFYHLDQNKKEIDNYCYITNNILDYKTGTLHGIVDMKFYAWENGFGTDIKSYRDTYMREDWTFSLPNQVMVSNTNLSLINAYYSKIGGGETFADYLNNRGVKAGKEGVPATVVTNFIGGRDFSSDDKVSMFIKNCHNNPDKFKGKDYLKGDVTTVTSSSSHFKVRRKAVADVFDLDTCTATNSKRLGALASFYERYTFKDDLVVFWDAEYYNPQNVDERKALAEKEKNFYYRDRWDKPSDDEERYTSSVTYNRVFGSILCRPLGSDEDYYKGINVVNPSNQARFDLFNLDSLSTAFSEEEKKAIKEWANTISEVESTLDKTASKVGVDYQVYFDETTVNGLSFKTYEKIYGYLQDSKVVNMLADDIKTYSQTIRNNMKSNQELYNLDYDDADVLRITKDAIKNVLNCVVVDKFATPNRKDHKNIYDMSTGKLYVWNDNKHRYTEFDASDDVIIKRDKYGRIKKTKQETPTFVQGDLPTSKTRLSIKLISNTTLAFEIKNNGGEIDYEVKPVYHFVPVIIWDDGSNAERRFEIPESVLSLMDIVKDKEIKIAVPVIESDKKDDKANVAQYFDIEQVDSPALEGVFKIHGFGTNRYVLVNPTDNGPFVVLNAYHKHNGDYSAPSTGIE